MKYSKNGYKRNSKDRNNPYNIIPSGNITMEGVDFPVLGTDNLGNQKLMMPGANYVFPGNTVLEVPLAQNGIEVPKRKGVRLNYDEEGNVIGESTHIMRTEQLEDGTWVSFPSLFENEDGEWVDMSSEKNWMKIYEEAKRRGEVINFGDDKEAALAFGKGSWKPDYPQLVVDNNIERAYYDPHPLVNTIYMNQNELDAGNILPHEMYHWKQRDSGELFENPLLQSHPVGPVTAQSILDVYYNRRTHDKIREAQMMANAIGPVSQFIPNFIFDHADQFMYVNPNTAEGEAVMFENLYKDNEKYLRDQKEVLKNAIYKQNGGSLFKAQGGTETNNLNSDFEELDTVDLTDKKTEQTYYPDYNFYDLSKEKEKLIEKLQTDAFKDRYFKQYENVTGNQMTDEEYEQRLADQIAFIQGGSDMATPILYSKDDEGNIQVIASDDELAKRDGYGIYSALDETFLQDFLKKSRGHVEFLHEKDDQGEMILDENGNPIITGYDIGLLGPKEWEAIELFYGPDGYKQMVSPDGQHPMAHAIMQHELSHLYNTKYSPLWSGVEGYDEGAHYIKDIFGQDQPWYDSTSHGLGHTKKIEEIGAGKVMFEQALSDYGIWDPNEGEFTDKHLKKLNKVIRKNKDFLKDPRVGNYAFVDFSNNQGAYVDSPEVNQYLTSLGLSNPSTDYLGDYNYHDFEGITGVISNRIMESDLSDSLNIIDQYDSKYHSLETKKDVKSRDGDIKNWRRNKKRIRKEDKLMDDFLSDKGIKNMQNPDYDILYDFRGSFINDYLYGRNLGHLYGDGEVKDGKYFTSSDTFEKNHPGFESAPEEIKEKYKKKFQELFAGGNLNTLVGILNNSSKGWNYNRGNLWNEETEETIPYTGQPLSDEDIAFYKDFETQFQELSNQLKTELYDYHKGLIDNQGENVKKYLNEIAMEEDASMDNTVMAKYGAELPKAQYGKDIIMDMQNTARLNEAGYDTELSDLRQHQGVSPITGGSYLLDILNIPGNLMAEAFEGIGNYGDKEFNFSDAMPGFYGDFSFRNMHGEPTKTVAGVTDVQGFIPSLLVNIFTDPTSYVGVGLVSKAGTGTKAISKTSKVINATDDLAVASKNTPTSITKPATETVHTPGSVHDYLTKYWNDPKFQKYQTTEMVRNARQYNDDMMMRNLYFKQRQDGVDLALKYGHDHPIVRNYYKEFVDPYPTFSSFLDNFKPTFHDKINYRSSFNDIINRQTRFGNQGMDFLNQKFKPRTFNELMDPKLLDRNYFNLLFDKMRTPTGKSSLGTFKSWMKDNKKTLGLYYPKGVSGYLGDKIYIKNMLTSPRLLTTRLSNPKAYFDQIKSTKIHEWSHFLDKSGTTLSSKQLDDLTRLADPFKRMKIIDEGLYGSKLARDYFYYTKPTEIKARMMELRNYFNLLPSQKFTMEHLKKSGDMFGMRPYLSVDDRPELFLDIMNKYYREGGENEIDFDQLERGIRYAESLNGELMKNKNSSASGFYGQLFSEIEDEYEGTREDFIKDTDYQLELFTKRANGELEDVPGLISNGNDLYSEYQDQLDLSKHGLNPLTIAGLSNMLGRQGTREYIGYVLRDGKTIEEVFPHLYGENAEYPNHTPEEYIAKFNKGLITKKEGGSTLRKVRRIKQQLKKYKEGKEISYIAKKELINLGLIDNQLTPNQSVR